MEYQIIATISGILIILSFSQLVFKVHKTKETIHLTFSWLFLLLSAQLLLLFYGIMNKSYGIYVPAIIISIGLLYILYIKLTYENLFNEKIVLELKEKDIII